MSRSDNIIVWTGVMLGTVALLLAPGQARADTLTVRVYAKSAADPAVLKRPLCLKDKSAIAALCGQVAELKGFHVFPTASRSCGPISLEFNTKSLTLGGYEKSLRAVLLGKHGKKLHEVVATTQSPDKTMTDGTVVALCRATFEDFGQKRKRDYDASTALEEPAAASEASAPSASSTEEKPPPPSPELPPAYGLYVGADAGTSFSPNGIGIIAGAELGRLRPELGYSLLSKNGQLGQGWSGSLFYEFPLGLYIGLGMTRYVGKGSRRAVYEEGAYSRSDVNASWEMNYERFSLGYVLRKESLPVRVFFEGGAAAVRYSRITTTGTDYSNVGPATGIDVETNHFDDLDGGGTNITGAGAGDWGVYLRIGAYYMLK